MGNTNKRLRKLLALAALNASILTANPVFAQHRDHESQVPSKEMEDEQFKMSQMDHTVHRHEHTNRAVSFLMGESSGTGFQPSAWPMSGRMDRMGSWHVMVMGQAYVIGTQQSGDRGKDKIYSSNWLMVAGARQLGRGAMMVRTMISLEPLTVSGRQYPLVFQTGETAYGKPIVDGQHPHDIFMELGIQYAHPFGKKGVVNVYYAPVGDAALGPIAFPHRASAQELPQATLGHHWQDATHIANNLATIGISYGMVRWEGSVFYGHEPNEDRWNIDFGKMDSWAMRLSLSPTQNWTGQISVGWLNNPETFHKDDVFRTTASIHHITTLSGTWATSLIWARNYKTEKKYATHAMTAETLIPIGQTNFLTGRFEWSQRDELFEYDHDLAEQIEQTTGRRAFSVAAFTVGYTRDLNLFRSVQTGIGTNVTAYLPDKVPQPFYGEHPVGGNVFVRIRLK